MGYRFLSEKLTVFFGTVSCAERANTLALTEL